MQGWIVAGGWLFAVLFAVVVLGFTAYELNWKSRRLLTDKARLDQLLVELGRLTEQLGTAADRLR